MSKIEEKYLQQLRDAGLFVSKPYSPTHGWPDGVRVGKPVSTPGNSIADYRDGGFISIEGFEHSLGPPFPPEMDAPMIVLCSNNEVWTVDSCDSAGGMRSSDFINKWASGDEAIADILSLYFGDPQRMRAKAKVLMRWKEDDA